MKKILITLFVASVPYIVHAQPPRTLADIIGRFIQLINVALPIVITASLLVFIWGAIKLIATAGDDQSRMQGRRLLIWGLIALLTMVAVWGIVRLIQVSFLL